VAESQTRLKFIALTKSKQVQATQKLQKNIANNGQLPMERLGSANATAAAAVAGRLQRGRGSNNNRGNNNKWRHFGPQLHVPLIYGKFMWRKIRRTGRMSDISRWLFGDLKSDFTVHPVLLLVSFVVCGQSNLFICI